MSKKVVEDISNAMVSYLTRQNFSTRNVQGSSVGSARGNRGKQGYPIPQCLRPEEKVNEDMDDTTFKRMALIDDVITQKSALFKKHNIVFDRSKPLGKGHGQSGTAFDAKVHGRNVVLKLTTDESEAKASMSLKGKKLEHAVKIISAFKIKDTEVFGIIQEKLQELSAEEKSKVSKFYSFLKSHAMLSDLKGGNFGHFIEMLQALKNVSDDEKQEIIMIAEEFDIPKMMEELNSNGIQFFDYNEGNIMKRNNKYVVTDIGHSKSSGAEPLVLEKIIKSVLQEVKRPQMIAVYAGKFQPFHTGFASIVRNLLMKYRTVVLLMLDKEEPFTFDIREKMISRSLSNMSAKLEIHKVSKIDNVIEMIDNVVQNDYTIVDRAAAITVYAGEDYYNNFKSQLENKKSVISVFDPKSISLQKLSNANIEDGYGSIKSQQVIDMIKKNDKAGFSKVVDPTLLSDVNEFNAIFEELKRQLNVTEALQGVALFSQGQQTGLGTTSGWSSGMRSKTTDDEASGKKRPTVWQNQLDKKLGKY
jgi:nicotinamide mononucleotide adenylyltransferase